MSKERFKLAVVGHGRGATTFVNTWLNHNGILTRHEAMGKDGIVDNVLAVPTWPIRQGWAMGKFRDDFEFDHKVAVVRNPWKVIATYYAVEPDWAIWRHDPHVDLSAAGDDRLSAICLSVPRWTRSAIAWANQTYMHAETWHQNAPQWLINHGFEDRDWREVPANTINHTAGKRLTRENIVARVSPAIAQEVKQFSEELGYE